MRGIAYALTEIAVFMIAATLLGYLLGRLAGPSRAARAGRRAQAALEERTAQAEAVTVRLEHRAESMAEEAAVAQTRVVELEAELDDVLNASAEEPDQGSPITDSEVDELLAEIDRQREVIARLESVSDGSTSTVEAPIRDDRIAFLEAALLAADDTVEGADLALAFSSTSSGSGRYADATIDFEIIP